MKNKFNLILADPPWRFGSEKAGGSMQSGAAAKYPTMSIAELKAMDVKALAADDCMLIMWWVGSQPQEALDLVKAWGFQHKVMNGFVWRKLTATGKPFFGMGYYTRAGSESALIATKGKASALVADHSVRSVREAPVGKHSAKPLEFYDDFIKLCGDVPRVELFARTVQPDWHHFGNEVERDVEINVVTK